jgi:subtilisin family serine protease
VAILQDSRTSKDDADRLGHGTACINTLLAIAPACEVVPIRVFESTLETAPTELIRAIDWAVNSGSHVINLSLGTSSTQLQWALVKSPLRGQAVVWQYLEFVSVSASR